MCMRVRESGFAYVYVYEIVYMHARMAVCVCVYTRERRSALPAMQLEWPRCDSGVVRGVYRVYCAVMVAVW